MDGADPLGESVMAYTPGYSGRGPRRSDNLSRAIYALVVVTAAAVSVLPLLLLDEVAAHRAQLHPKRVGQRLQIDRPATRHAEQTQLCGHRGPGNLGRHSIGRGRAFVRLLRPRGPGDGQTREKREHACDATRPARAHMHAISPENRPRVLPSCRAYPGTDAPVMPTG